MSSELIDFIEKFGNLLQDLNNLQIQKNTLNTFLDTQLTKQENIKNNIEILEGSLTYYKKAADILQYQRLDDLIAFVNQALEYVYFDEKYSLRIELNDKYSKALVLQIYDGKKDLLKPLRKGVGKGLRAIVGFILQIYFCCEYNATIIWQDETLVNISKKYVERIFNYVKILCEARNISQVMITHDTRFFKYADKVYLSANGQLVLE